MLEIYKKIIREQIIPKVNVYVEKEPEEIRDSIHKSLLKLLNGDKLENKEEEELLTLVEKGKREYYHYRSGAGHTIFYWFTHPDIIFGGQLRVLEQDTKDLLKYLEDKPLRYVFYWIIIAVTIALIVVPSVILCCILLKFIGLRGFVFIGMYIIMFIIFGMLIKRKYIEWKSKDTSSD